jgi:hypothetical protein
VSSNVLICDADLFGSTTYSVLNDLVSYIHEELFVFLVEKHDMKNKEPFSSDEDKDQCFHLLSQLEDATMSGKFALISKLSEFLVWLFDVWEVGDDSSFFLHFPLLSFHIGLSGRTCC